MGLQEVAGKDSRLPEVGKQDFKLSRLMLLDFIESPSDVKLIGSYSYMLNCMYMYSLRTLINQEVKYSVDNTVYSGTSKDMKNKDKYSQCEIIGHYLIYKGIMFDRDSLKLMITFRNKLVHEPRFIKLIKTARISIFPNYQEMLKISNVLYSSNVCGDYIKAVTQFCIGKNPEGYIVNPDELPDVVNSGLNKTNSEPDLMEQLMNQNKE